jgi:nitric oxide synthase-interacting protein
MSNLLAQRTEIARLEKAWERQKEDGKEKELLDEVEETERAVLEFEKVQMGLEGARRKGESELVDAPEEAKKGTKRDFELDEDELLRIAKDERKKMRSALDSEKVSR